jgi:hypothetical protein
MVDLYLRIAETKVQNRYRVLFVSQFLTTFVIYIPHHITATVDDCVGDEFGKIKKDVAVNCDDFEMLPSIMIWG